MMPKRSGQLTLKAERRCGKLSSSVFPFSRSFFRYYILYSAVITIEGLLS
jgi:hypothetical protein